VVEPGGGEPGLERWVDDVLPAAIECVSDHHGGAAVHVVGWSLGGVTAALAMAGDGGLPVRSLALVASPFEPAGVPRAARALRRTIDRGLTRPLAVAARLHDRDFLAQVEAVDALWATKGGWRSAPAAPAAAWARLDELAGGRLAIGPRTVALADVRVPVLAIAGTDDVLAPSPAVHRAGRLLTGAPEMELETAPGGTSAC
jgi:polyhydroxyalkanoate synthase